MCCQIFYRKSVAPSRGNRRHGRQVKEFWRRKNFLEVCLPNHFRNHSRSSARGSLREFSISSDVKYGAHGALRYTIENLSPFFGFCDNFCFEKLRRLKVDRNKLLLNLSYYFIFKFFFYKKIYFGLMGNKTVLGWDSLSHHCRNLSNMTCNYLIRGFTFASLSWKNLQTQAKKFLKSFGIR